MRYLSKCLIGLVCISMLARPIYAKADTDLDLMSFYGFTVPEVYSAEDQKNYKNVSKKYKASKYYNESARISKELVDSYLENVTLQLHAKTELLNDYNSKSEELLKYLNDNKALITLEEVKRASKELESYELQKEELITSINQFKVIPLGDDEIEMDPIEEEMEQLEEKKLKASSLWSEIGDVNNILFPEQDVPRYVTSKFGYRIDPVYADGRGQFHSGTDYRAPEGTPLLALFNGTVISTGESKTGGKYVKVAVTPDIDYVYYHMSDVQVAEGDILKQYDVVGLSGATGSRCTGPHLHITMHIYNTLVDVDQLFTH